MKKAIIFGSGGQDGYYLARLLQSKGVLVDSYPRTRCNVVSQAHVTSIIRTLEPDYVFHFGAESSTKHETLYRNQGAIVDGTLNILEAVRLYSPHSKVYLAGSVLQFEDQDNVTLENRRAYDSIYAAQRNAMTGYARYYRSLGLQVYIGYFSHHDSPMRGPNHLAQRIATEAKLVAKGMSPHLRILDPSDQKEWNFAGDMMEAVWQQVNGPAFEAVLGCGYTHSVGEYAEACVRAAGIDYHPGVYPNVYAEFTREWHTKTCTADMRFEHCFKTTMPELAKMMVTG